MSRRRNGRGPSYQVAPPEWWPLVGTDLAWRQLVQVLLPVRRARTADEQRRALDRALRKASRILERHGARLDEPEAQAHVAGAIAKLANVHVSWFDPRCDCAACLEASLQTERAYEAAGIALAVGE